MRQTRQQLEMGMHLTRPKRRLVVGVVSAVSYVHRRSACRQTWVAEAAEHADVEVVFVLGGGPTLVQAFRLDDVLFVPGPDGYDSLPRKTYGFLKWALENFDFQVAFKCDDDTYVHIQRLLRYGVADRDYVGADMGGYASGGAGYRISSRAVSSLLPALEGRSHGPEDLIVGEVLRERGVALTASGLFRPYSTPGDYPTPTNQIITCHYVQPEKMFEIHASLGVSSTSLPEPPYQILDWKTGRGVLGLYGTLDHGVDGSTDIQRPDLALDWSCYEFLSGHVDCGIELQVERPVGVFGFLDGRSPNVPEAPVIFSIDGDALGSLFGPGERTAEGYLRAGRRILRAATSGAKAGRYVVWAIREL
jgi:Galactosyltransferase